MALRPTGAVECLRVELPSLAAEASARAEEFERGRNVSADFVDKLKRAGVYSVLVSRERGGLGGTLLDWLEVITALAHADASTGWVAAHGAVCSALIENIAGSELIDAFFADPMASAAWSNMPRLEVQEMPGGLRLSGRWTFGTGCLAATHVGGMVPLAPTEAELGPRFVVALVPRALASIDETWDPVGLAGTGSHDIVFHDVLVPWSQIFAWPNAKPNNQRPTSVFVPGTWFVTICAAAVHLGLARRALDEARRELAGKTDRFSKRPLLEKPASLIPLEEAEGLLFACRAGLEKVLDEIWQAGCRGEALDNDARLRVRLAAVTAVHQGERIVRSAYDIAGASAIMKSGLLQRLYRDASCLTHHVSANRDSFEVIGRVRCGFDPLTFRI